MKKNKVLVRRTEPEESRGDNAKTNTEDRQKRNEESKYPRGTNNMPEGILLLLCPCSFLCGVYHVLVLLDPVRGGAHGARNDPFGSRWCTEVHTKCG